MAVRRSRAERAAGALAVALLGASPGWAVPSADERLRELASGRDVLRIGLDAADSVIVEGSGGGYRLVDPATGEAVWRGEFAGPIAVIPEGVAERPASRFRVQVGSYADARAAEDDRAALEQLLGVPAVVVRDPDRESYRVRVADARDRDSLGAVMDRLRAAGRTGMWIVEEPVREVRGALRLVDTRTFESLASGLERVVAIPRGTTAIATGGKSYRGVLEVRATRYGTVRAINWIPLEAYLRGVVPAEMGPEVWPQIEALKAQAIAARTYAWRHRGQFEEDGYDLCATPRCQAYGGQSAEHALSDRAVAETHGEILTWEGLPATTLYTATCGGHTENADAVFPEERAPYLVGVPCHAEGGAAGPVWISGRAAERVATPTGQDVTRERAMLVCAGVLDAEMDARALAEPLEEGDLERWATHLARLAGLAPPEGRPTPVADLGQAAEALVRAVGWLDRAAVLLRDPDLAAILRDPETDALTSGQRRALAYLATQELVVPGADGRWGVGGRPIRSRLLPALAGIGETYEAFNLRSGVVSGVEGRTLRVARGKSEVRVPVATDAYLFGSAGGRATALDRLPLWAGDRVRYRTRQDGAIDLLELSGPIKGASDDRSAAVHSWQERLTGRELQRNLDKTVAVGTVRDLVVARRGVSGRVVELRVIGDRGTEVIRGFDVRRALGLRESLVAFEIQRDVDGTIAAVVFTGRGWGHGVGMCQVGAYGMAVRGSTYREILAHYYSGTVIGAIAGSRP